MSGTLYRLGASERSAGFLSSEPTPLFPATKMADDHELQVYSAMRTASGINSKHDATYVWQDITPTTSVSVADGADGHREGNTIFATHFQCNFIITRDNVAARDIAPYKLVIALDTSPVLDGAGAYEVDWTDIFRNTTTFTLSDVLAPPAANSRFRIVHEKLLTLENFPYTFYDPSVPLFQGSTMRTTYRWGGALEMSYDYTYPTQSRTARWIAAILTTNSARTISWDFASTLRYYQTRTALMGTASNDDALYGRRVATTLYNGGTESDDDDPMPVGHFSTDYDWLSRSAVDLSESARFNLIREAAEANTLLEAGREQLELERFRLEHEVFSDRVRDRFMGNPPWDPRDITSDSVGDPSL